MKEFDFGSENGFELNAEMAAFMREVKSKMAETNGKIDQCITDFFKEMQLTHKDEYQRFVGRDALAFRLRSALIDCHAKLVFFNDPERGRLDELKEKHQRWIELAMADPFISEWLKATIRDHTTTKRTYRANELTMELARCLAPVESKIKAGFKLKTNETVEALHNLLTSCLGQVVTLDTFEKAMQKVRRKGKETSRQ